MRNLLTETLQAIQDAGNCVDDIIFIGSEESGHSCTWGEFTALADKVYDNGFGSQEVAYDLVIVFSDGTKMLRDEYDGSEGWVAISPFVMPEKVVEIKSLFKVGIIPQSLDEIHSHKEVE